MRPLSACIACRDRCKKCHRSRVGTSCTFCIKRGLECVFEKKPSNALKNGYDPLFSPRGDGAIPISSVSSTSIMPEPDLLDELVGLYFRYIHVTFHNLFHRASFEAAVKDGSIEKVLVFGIIGLAARFSSHPYFADIEPCDRGRPYVKEAERLLDLHKTCLTTVQACILLGANQVVEMDSATESIYYTVACRLAMILDLPNANAETRIGQEVNLRVWWSAVTTDTWSSTALGLPRAIKPRYGIPMPMDERVFATLETDQPPHPNPALDPAAEPSRSLIAQMVKLNKILYDINIFNTNVVSGDVSEVEVQETVTKLSMALDSWISELPVGMHYSDDNISYWADQGFGSSFIVLHINYNHLGQLLFYRFLHRALDSPQALSANTSMIHPEKCKKHAADLCNLIQHATQHPGTEVKYPLVGHVLVIASTVHIYILLFSSDDAEIQVAKSRLKNNFQTISLLQKYWPSLEASFSRLDAFHKVCLQSKDSSFQLDRWMLQFLLEFAKPIGERATKGIPYTLLEERKTYA